MKKILLFSSMFILFLTACTATDSDNKPLGYGLEGYIKEIDSKKKTIVTHENDPKTDNDSIKFPRGIKVNKKTIILKNSAPSSFDTLKIGQHIRFWYYGGITDHASSGLQYFNARQIEILE